MYGQICDKIISNKEKFPTQGLFHIFSSDISKFDMLEAFKEKYKINVNIEPSNPHPVDRRLRSVHDMCKNLNIPDFYKMLKDL
jgi:hypothetical protein